VDTINEESKISLDFIHKVDKSSSRNNASAITRIGFLDGLRGYAAVQVVLLHYVSAFAPAVGGISPETPHPAWQKWFIHSPLFFFANGFVAVSLFFLISGTVLTYAFRKGTNDFFVHAVRRLIRLGLPMGASILLASVLFLLLPQSHLEAGALLGSASWLGSNSPLRIDIGGILKEIFVGGMLFGHVGATLLPGPIGYWIGLPLSSHSYNAPLWTLHLECYGSLLVLMLVKLENRMSDVCHKYLFIALLVLLFTHPLDLFVIGYGTAKLLNGKAWAQLTARWWAKCLAGLSIILGIGMSVHTAPVKVLRGFDRFSSLIHFPMRLDAFHALDHYAAILIYFGILALPGLQRLLAARIGRALGRYSFSLYLVHFPILFTVTSAIVVWTHHFSHGRVALAVSSGLILTVMVTIFFEHWVDTPSTMLSHMIGRWLSKPAKAETPTTEPEVIPPLVTGTRL